MAKGILSVIPGIVMVFVVITVILATGLNVIYTMKSSYGNTTAEYASLANTTSGLSNIATNFGLLGTIIIFAIIIMVLLYFFGGFGATRGGV